MKNLSIDTKNTSVCDLVEKLDDFIFFGLKYVNLCYFLQIKLSCDLHRVKNLSIDTKNTSVCDLVEKLEDFIFFGLKYGNLCKLGCPVVFKS